MSEIEVTQMTELLGHTLTVVRQNGDDEISFMREDGRCVVMYHEQDCCECVTIEDIDGDLQDLVGSKILEAEFVTSRGDGSWDGDYQTWTFYKIGTAKGFVNIRWLGESNGYYSEEVNIRVD